MYEEAIKQIQQKNLHFVMSVITENDIPKPLRENSYIYQLKPKTNLEVCKEHFNSMISLSNKKGITQTVKTSYKISALFLGLAALAVLCGNSNPTQEKQENK